MSAVRATAGVAWVLATALLAGVLASASGASAAQQERASSGGAATAAHIARQLRSVDAGDADGVGGVEQVSPAPAVTASGWIVYDESTKEPIAARDATTPRPIASLAKLMTAVLAVERAQQDDVVTIPAAINELPPDAATMGLRAGEEWTVRDLLRGLMIVSANDAAIALAAKVAGDEASFVDLMNERAAKLELSSTRFGSATGLDLAGATSSSTPVDLVALTEAALEDEDIAAAAGTQELELDRPGAPAGAEPVQLVHRHPLVGRYEGVDGVKTGFTDQAGYMLVTHFVDPDTDGRLVVVTANSSSEATRASDTRALLDWARTLRTDVLVAEGGERVGSVPVLNRSERVEVFVCDDAEVSARVGQRVRTKVVLPRMLDAPLRAGDEIGELRIAVGAADAERVPLCSASGLRDDGLLGRLKRAAAEYDSAWDAGTDEVRDAWRKLAG